MPSKQQLDKEAWDWALTTDPQKIKEEHIERAYRLRVPPCKTACRRNCRGNPHCLSGLGEKNWINEIADEEWHEIDDPNAERREEGSFVGLKNLGATCYVNSLLQVWYHNVNFRTAIYKWKPEEDPQEKDTFDEEKEFKPVSCIGHLQLVFALLQFSCRKYIDPTPLISMLGLNTSQQQDAQEFCQLFISLIEEKLSHQSDPVCRNIVQERYSGEYAYVTRCHSCSNESHRTSQFYELDLGIKGHKDLFECIDEFGQEEKLEGSNQYYCGRCQSKRDATRFIRLRRLPPVLHLQLLRFVFDRQTGCKKKLNSFIRFPEVLDMSRYLSQPEKTMVYEVSAVLIHRGVSAHSGHYVAHIKEAKTNAWYKFNDETVEKIVGKTLKLGGLGAEENLTEEPGSSSSNKGANKAPKALKGWHSSNNAYMLVYTLKEDKIEDKNASSVHEAESLPLHLQMSVSRDNSAFEEWVKELAIMREQNVAIGKERQTDIRKIYEKLPLKERGVDGEEYEFIASNWLKKWLTSNSGAVAPLDNSHCLCLHEKLSPDAVDKVKCVSKLAADSIYEKYGGGPRLGSESLCRKCVEARCHIFRVKARLTADQKVFATLIKAKITNDEEAYWIGKSSLRSWRRLVLLQNEDLSESQQEEDEQNNDNENVNGGENGGGQGGTMGETQLEDEDDEDNKLLFNEDLLCEHGNLKVNEGSRKLLKVEAWNLLRQYFTDSPEFKRGAAVCPECLRLRNLSNQTKERHKQLAQEQKNALLDLYLDRNRPTLAKLELHPDFYGVTLNFLEEWRRFVKDPVRREPVISLGNGSLLCEHGGLPFLLDSELSHSRDTSRLCLVWDREWEVVKSTFLVDREIRVYRQNNENGVSTIQSTPEVCGQCLLARLEAERAKELDYCNAKIFVRRVSKVDGDAGNLDAEFSEDGLASAELTSGDDDNNFMAVAKKVRLNPEVSPSYGVAMEWSGNKENSLSAVNPTRTIPVTNEPVAVSIQPVAAVPSATERDTTTSIFPRQIGSPPISSMMEKRRSARRRKARGEKEMLVSSSQSLKDLKVQIMKEFSVAPFDQHLTLNGKPLRDNQATLASLRVIPGSLILLKADEVGEEAIVMEDYLKATTPETGFKGTGLLSS